MLAHQGGFRIDVHATLPSGRPQTNLMATLEAHRPMLPPLAAFSHGLETDAALFGRCDIEREAHARSFRTLALENEMVPRDIALPFAATGPREFVKRLSRVEEVEFHAVRRGIRKDEERIEEASARRLIREVSPKRISHVFEGFPRLQDSNDLSPIGEPSAPLEFTEERSECLDHAKTPKSARVNLSRGPEHATH
jgi:hypothetical protein